MRRRPVIMIIGEPAVGKSTLLRKFLGISSWQFVNIKWVPHHFCRPHKIVVLGRYDEPDQQFPGTDRYSMAVHAHAIDYIVNRPDISFVFEGDRLGSGKFIRDLNVHGVKVILARVVVSDWVYKDRHARERDQSSKFLQSKRTKCDNMAKEFGCRVFPNDNEQQQARILLWLVETLHKKLKVRNFT